MELKERLDRVYKLLSVIPVAGDGVDAMFVARQELRKIFEELKEETDHGT